MKTIADIMAIKEKMQREIILRDNLSENETRLVVGMATCGISAGARAVFNALVDEIAVRNLKGVKVTRSGCLGMCKLEPIVEVYVPGQEKITYIRVDAEKAKKIIASHIVNGNVVEEYMITNE
ncbi:MAG TPA: (2Fe-2S) ferredoxin domain-containing protein [Eubacteriales bacterium]|jgi:NADP-reducing hydrogenase subunit HndB|nr:(2Fe-2S) ferredoxin domain-containing protein [Clostridia bacterium]HRR89692.1 (2Fe-2S) ferredoxin domain-containing protein [Eubacteriales bacterium]HRU84597.1 (2Fe-2S) ferredoxin domain-containing protein [Eubacteriales bacterium]